MSYNPNSTGAKVELTGSTSGSFTQFASAITTSYSVIWPAAQAASSGYVLMNDGAGNLSWSASGGSGVSSLNSLTGAITLLAGSGITITPSGSNITIASTGGGSGTVTSVSVASANGFAGSVANATTTPAITINTSVSGILFGNGTSVAAAIPSNFPILNQNTTGNAATVTTNANLTGVVTSVGNATSIANGAITNAMLAISYNVNNFTLSPTDITNKFVTLSSVPDIAADTIMTVIGGPMQSYGADYTVSGSQLGWSGLFLDGVLVSGDMLVVQYN